MLLMALATAGFASPLSPEQERSSFRLADPRLTIDLVAAEPDVRAPVALAWDADGRMFVAEMTDYPSGPVSGRIRMLEDRDGDGRCEHSVIFATNIAYPNSVMPWRNGVLVTAAPDIWFLADTNGDGRADVREKILTGFPEGNQQLRVNGLFWGIDNWIYGANGRSDGEVKWPDGTPAGSIRRKDFRFRPDTKQFEAIAGHSQFGMGHDDWGNRFPVFNATPIRHVVLEDRYLARQPLLEGTDNVPNISPADGTRVFALTHPTLLIPQPIGHFTSACGPSVYRGTALPEDYRGNFFVCEPVQNVVQGRVLKPSGSTFIAEFTPGTNEFLASTDRWFHGVFTATGPDGALYIVDFYRDLVEHPQWVAPELRDKVDWRKGEEHGRIWRVRANGAKPVNVPKFSRVSNAELVKALESRNGWTRDTAHRLLIERDARDAIGLLEELIEKTNSVLPRVHALHVLSGFRALHARHVSATLHDKHPRIREHGVLLAERFFSGVPDSRVDVRVADQNAWNHSSALIRHLTNAVKVLGNDPDARVRLQVAATFGTVPDKGVVFSGLARVAEHKELDRWQSHALLAAVGDEPFPLFGALLGEVEHGTREQQWLAARLCHLAVAQRNETKTVKIARWIAQSSSTNRFDVAAAFLEGHSVRERATAIEQIGGPQLVREVIGVSTNGVAPLEARLAAVKLLDLARATGAVSALGFLLSRGEPEPLQVAAAKSLCEWEDGALARLALGRWKEISGAARRQIVTSSIRGTKSALALVSAMENSAVAVSELDATVRQTLEKHREAAVRERAGKLFASAVSPDREAVVQKFRPALKLATDHKRGAAIFEKNCAVCHQMQGVGAKVGPDLSGTGQKPRETLLVQILDPSRQVLPDFVAYTAESKDGETYTGFIANESAVTVTLRRANEPDITLERANLKSLATSGKSLMPDGLEAAMSEQDVADLIEFLRRPDRTLFSELR